MPTAAPGVADIVGFGTNGVVIMRNTINFHPVPVVKCFGLNAGGWSVDKHVRLLADTTRKKAMDIVGFGEDGVWISTNNGNNTFTDPKMALSSFAFSGGWHTDKHIRFMADVRNIGRCDVVGFGDLGVALECMSPSTAAMAISALPYSVSKTSGTKSEAGGLINTYASSPMLRAMGDPTSLASGTTIY